MHDTLKALCSRPGAPRLSFKYGEPSMPYEKQDEWQRKAHGYRCTLRYQGRAYIDADPGLLIWFEESGGRIVLVIADTNTERENTGTCEVRA